MLTPGKLVDILNCEQIVYSRTIVDFFFTGLLLIFSIMRLGNSYFRLNSPNRAPSRYMIVYKSQVFWN